jgi:hypothetical protein
MNKAVLYVHGKGGSAEESKHYSTLFTEYDIIGIDYKSETPWDAKREFSSIFDELKAEYSSIILIANSIGAYYSMLSLYDKSIDKAFFMSPIVDMEQLIGNMMNYDRITDEMLREKKFIQSSFGETLSWEYLAFVRANPVKWNIPTSILYGENDELTSYQTMAAFADRVGADLTVMSDGEHWFHTEEQMRFLDNWIMSRIKAPEH